MEKGNQYAVQLDGLRFIAVFMVMIAHWAQWQFTNELIASIPFVHGVILFFVLSGFLITRILMQGAEAGGSSGGFLKNFYIRRVLRIFPIYYLLIFTLFILNYQNTRDIFFWLATYTINIFQAIRNEYVGDFNHFWSLGVEEQFYVLYPLVLFILFRIKHFRLVYSLVCLWLMSFLLAFWCSLQISNSPSGINNIPVASFYNLPTRSFELLTGAIAVFVLPMFHKLNPRHNVELVTKLLGAILVIISGFYLPTHVNYPNAYSLIPLLGTFLVLITEEENLATRILSNRILVTIGLMSFSLYLIHQPLFAFYRLSIFDSASKIDFLFLILKENV